MTIIDAEKFLAYLIFSKHIDGLTCGEVKEAIEMCKVDDVLDKIKAELERRGGNDEKAFCKELNSSYKLGLREAIEIIDKYRGTQNEQSID